MPAANRGSALSGQLPRNVEAEAALLGAMMIDNRLADDVVGRVEAVHFFEPVHGRIFAAIVAMRRRDMLATPVTLRPMFETDEGIAVLGGPSYLGALTGSGAGLIGARQFAQQIYDLAALRALIEVGRTLIDRAMDTSEEVNPRAQIEAAETLLASVAIGGAAAAPKPVGFAQAWDSAIRKAKAVANGTASRGAMIARFVEWNEITGGMSPGQLILLGGRPGKQARRIWAARAFDHPTDPVSIYRFIVFLAGCAVASRGGAEAISLWSWSSGDAHTIERVAELKRWLDPVSVGCGFLWMALHILAEPMLEFQLRKAPLPVDMWSRWPQLRRPIAILVVSLAMATAAVGLR